MVERSKKIVSKLTGECVSYFNERRKYHILEKEEVANFDCRIYKVPTLEDAVAQILWRENDATKNSIYSLAQSMFPHKQLQNLNGKQLQEKMMVEKGVNWNDVPVKFKRGSYVKRTIKEGRFSEEELKHLPLKHKALSGRTTTFKRSVIEVVEYPVLNRILNKVEVIFNGEDPVTY